MSCNTPKPDNLNLRVVAPRLSKQYEEELRTLGVTVQAEETGLWRLGGGPAIHPTWVLETAALAGVRYRQVSRFDPTQSRDFSTIA